MTPRDHDMPTFYECKAFLDDFRRRWKYDKGLVSLFEKRQKYKLANEKSFTNNCFPKIKNEPILSKDFQNLRR